MTPRPSRPELRHSILARLSSFTAEVEWAETGAHTAFADSIVDFADWLANTTPPPPALRGPSSTAAGRAAARALFERTRRSKEQAPR